MSNNVFMIHVPPTVRIYRDMCSVVVYRWQGHVDRVHLYGVDVGKEGQQWWYPWVAKRWSQTLSSHLAIYVVSYNEVGNAISIRFLKEDIWAQLTRNELPIPGQHDASEFWLLAMQCFDEDPPTPLQALANVFNFKVTTTNKCLWCGDKRKQTHPGELLELALLDINISVTRHMWYPVHGSTVQSCLQKHYQPEDVAIDDSIICDKCGGKTPHRKWIHPIRFGDVLAISLKRFKWIQSENRRTKLTRKIGFGTTWELPHTSGTSKTYHLRAVVKHKGNIPDAGHWVSCVRASNGDWILKDDDAPPQILSTANVLYHLMCLGDSILTYSVKHWRK